LTSIKELTLSKITVNWLHEKIFVGTDSNRHSIVIGRSADPEQTWIGMKPSDLLLLAVASCAVYDIVEILQKQREPLLGLRVECSGDQLSDPPYSFTSIHNHYIVRGQVNPSKLEKAIRLSEDKYCSVISSLRPHVLVTSDFEIQS
jgi:putative redox protein